MAVAVARMAESDGDNMAGKPAPPMFRACRPQRKISLLAQPAREAGRAKKKATAMNAQRRPMMPEQCPRFGNGGNGLFQISVDELSGPLDADGIRQPAPTVPSMRQHDQHLLHSFSGVGMRAPEMLGQLAMGHPGRDRQITNRCNLDRHFTRSSRTNVAASKSLFVTGSRIGSAG